MFRRRGGLVLTQSAHVLVENRKRLLRVSISRRRVLCALLFGRHVVVLLEIFKEVADVEEGAGISPDIHEG